MPVVPLYHSPSIRQPVGGLARARHISTGMRIPLSQVGQASRTRAEVLNKMASQIKRQTSQAARSTRLVGRELARKERSAARDFRLITNTLSQLTGFGAKLAAAVQAGKSAQATTQYKVVLNNQEDEVKKGNSPAFERVGDWVGGLTRERQQAKHRVARDLDDISRDFLFSFMDLMEKPADARIRNAHNQKVIEQSLAKFEQAGETLRQEALKPGRSVDQLTEHTSLYDAVVDGAVAAGLMGPVRAGEKKIEFYSSLLTDKLGREIAASSIPENGGPSAAQNMLVRFEQGEFSGRLESLQTEARLWERARQKVNQEKREVISRRQAASSVALEAPQRLAPEINDDLEERLLTGRGHSQDYAAFLAAQGRNDAAAQYLNQAKAAGWVNDWLAARQELAAEDLARETRQASAQLAVSPLAQDRLVSGMIQRATELNSKKLTEDPPAALEKPIKARLKAMVESGEVDLKNPGRLVRGLAEAALAVQGKVGLAEPKILTLSQARQILDSYLDRPFQDRSELIGELARFGRHTGQVLTEAGLDDEVVVAGEMLARPQTRRAGNLALAGHLAGLRQVASERKEKPSPVLERAQADWAGSGLGQAAIMAARLQPANEKASIKAQALARTAGNLAAEYHRRGLGLQAAVRSAKKDMESMGRALIQEGRRYVILPPQADPDRAAALLEEAVHQLPSFTARIRTDYINRTAVQGGDPALAAWEFDSRLARLAQTGVWVNADGPGLPDGRAVFIDPEQGRPVSDHLGRPFTVTLAQKPASAVEDLPPLPGRTPAPDGLSDLAGTPRPAAATGPATPETTSRR